MMLPFAPVSFARPAAPCAARVFIGKRRRLSCADCKGGGSGEGTAAPQRELLVREGRGAGRANAIGVAGPFLILARPDRHRPPAGRSTCRCSGTRANASVAGLKTPSDVPAGPQWDQRFVAELKAVRHFLGLMEQRDNLPIARQPVEIRAVKAGKRF